jgi:hypothetical protein
MYQSNNDPFNGNLGITPEGAEIRESIKVEDAILCQVDEQSEEINNLMADTMAFITSNLPPN